MILISVGIRVLRSVISDGDGFPHYGKYWPISMGFLGIRNEAKGTGAGHHNGQFDIDEDVLWLGIAAELCFALDA